MYRVGSGGRKRGYGCNKLLLEGRPLLSTPPQSGAAEWMCNKLILSRQGSLRQVDVMCSLQLALRTTAPCNKANNNAASCTHPWPCLPHASLHPLMSYLSSCSLLHYHDMISIPLLDVLYDLTLANQCCRGLGVTPLDFVPAENLELQWYLVTIIMTQSANLTPSHEDPAGMSSLFFLGGGV